MYSYYKHTPMCVYVMKSENVVSVNNTSGLLNNMRLKLFIVNFTFSSAMAEKLCNSSQGCCLYICHSAHSHASRCSSEVTILYSVVGSSL